MSKQFPVEGLAELDRFLSAFPKNMQTNAYRGALRAAANVIRDEARLLAPKKTGKMAKAIKTGSPRKNQDGTFSVSVRLDGEHSYLGLFQEYGVAAHLIARTGKGEGRVAVRKAAAGEGTIQGGVMKIGADFVSGILSHPGHAAQPFMRPALDAKSNEAVQVFAKYIRNYMEGKTGFVAPMMDEAA